MLIALNGAMVMLLEIPITAITRRFPPKRVMAVGALIIGAGFGIVGFGNSLAILITAIVVFTLGEMIQAPVSGAFVADRAPAHLRGRYMGAYGLSFGMGLIFGPGLGTWLFQVNPQALWMSCFVVGAISAILILSVPNKRDTQEVLDDDGAG